MRPASSVGSGPGVYGGLVGVVVLLSVVEVVSVVVVSSASATVQQNAMMGAIIETFMMKRICKFCGG